MKKILLATTLLVALQTMAQSDTTKTDTVKAGNFIIVKKEKKSVSIEISTKKGVDVSYNSGKKKKRNSSINWWIVDLGFTNLTDNTNYATAQASNYLRTLNTTAGDVTRNSMRLNAGKSSNVNIWIFMKKQNISKNVLNLKYGLGLEMYNFRYDRNVSYRKDPAPFVFNDTISFSKNKLYAGYITAPLMININPTPNNNNGFSLSAGISAG
ncbi:MAG: hypothetical protein KBD28_10695, partial [Chitinophagaceae bacterium]|nr:hypothetical protein [Chitinophagaceae bacterium]